MDAPADPTHFLPTRRNVLACGAAVATAAHMPSAFAQNYPTGPIRFVVPYPAGGATDILARLIGEKLSTRFRQPVLIDNKSGASGMIGTDAVAKAAPDGHTVAITLSASLLTNQFLYEKMPYNPQRDLALVSQIVSSPIVLLVHPSVPVQSGPELVKYAAAKRTLSYGSWGVGSYPHLAGNHMSLMQKADLVHAPYKGEAPMLQDLIGGQIQMAYASALSAKPHIDAGRLKAIGVTGTQRMAVLPNVSTLLEQGLKDEVYSVAGFIGMAAPAKTPKEIVLRLAQQVQAICSLPEVASRINAMGFTVTADTPQAFAASYKRDLPIWERMVKQSGAKLE
jgi:tripartite-type tricarboxylate transporter receptor subunit TctC